MTILKCSGWQDYELLDSGHGQRLERFGQFKIIRPDPQAIWNPSLSNEWQNADAKFVSSNDNKGSWKKSPKMPENWQIKFDDLTLNLKLGNFKHLGIFPEQSVNWTWLKNLAKPNQKVLNLFGYTGIASLILAKQGVQVTHVDGSKPTITWANENQKSSHIEPTIRWIFEDAMRFCEREVRRGTKYDGILLDPPIYGHGPNGETWDLMKNLPSLLHLCKKLLPEKPAFLLVNAYAVSASSLMLSNLLLDLFSSSGKIEHGEIVLCAKGSEKQLSTGIFARYS